jgi:sugar phosphate permease
LNKQLDRWLVMFSLVFAGGSIYTLPYLYQTYSGPMLEILELSQTQLGLLSTAFGIFAVTCYFPGGWLADRISARALLTISLGGTGGLGLAFATFPPLPLLLAIQALWGITSILTFWGALIKATRAWGGPDEQGRAFGILEGGRGIVEFVLAASTVLLFGALGGGVAGLRGAVLVYAGAALLGALAVWMLVPPMQPQPIRVVAGGGGNLAKVLRMPIVWLLALIILIAYTSSLGGHRITQYAQDAFGMEADQAAWLSTLRQGLRPVGAIGAGFLAERVGTRRAMSVGFGVLALGFAALAWIPAKAATVWLLWTDVVVIALAVFALRGVYFALLEEGGVPLALTGTAAGVVSVIGFTGDVFFPPLTGWLVDSYGFEIGYQLTWRALAVACVLGLVVTRALRRYLPAARGARG